MGELYPFAFTNSRNGLAFRKITIPPYSTPRGDCP